MLLVPFNGPRTQNYQMKPYLDHIEQTDPIENREEILSDDEDDFKEITGTQLPQFLDQQAVGTEEYNDEDEPEEEDDDFNGEDGNDDGLDNDVV